MIAFVGQIHVAALGYQQRVTNGFGHLGEQGAHLLRRAQVERVHAHLHTIGVGDERAGLNGQEDVLQAGVLAVDVMHVVGGQVAGVVTLAQLHQRLVKIE